MTDSLTPLEELEDFCESVELCSLACLQRLMKEITNAAKRSKSIKRDYAELIEYEYRPFFHKACKNGDVNLEVIQCMLDEWPWIAELETEHFCPNAETESFAIHMACCNELCPGSVIELLLKRGSVKSLRVASVVDEGIESELDGNCDTYIKGLPLHYYLAREENVEFDIVKTLVEAYPQALLNNDNDLKVLPIHVALSNPSIDTNTLYNIIGYMLELEPSAIRSLDRLDRTLLIMACRNKSMSLKLFLLIFNKWPDAIRQHDAFFNLPIHELCNNKNMDEAASLDILRHMIKYDPTVLRIYDGQMDHPFHLAASNKSFEFCKEIMNVFPELIKTLSHGNLPIHEACYNSRDDSFETVQHMLKLNPDSIDTRNRNEELPIHIVAVRGRSKIVDLLLLHDPDAASKPSDHRRLPLHEVCSSREYAHLHTVQVLYDAYPQAIIARDEHGYIPVDLSTDRNGLARRGHETVVNFLRTQLNYVRKVEDTAALSIRNENGLLLLHQALVDKAPLGSIKLLVRGGPAALNTDQPLHLACQFSSAKVVQYLLRELDGGGLDQLDTNNDSILHCACRGGNLEVVKYLLNNHTSLVPSAMANVENKLPIHMLCEAGKLGTVDCESPEYIEMIWQMLLAKPEAIMS